MSDGNFNINAATAEQIDVVTALPGHGFEVVRYRKNCGRFDALRQLDEVPGLAGKVDDADHALLSETRQFRALVGISNLAGCSRSRIAAAVRSRHRRSDMCEII